MKLGVVLNQFELNIQLLLLIDVYLVKGNTTEEYHTMESLELRGVEEAGCKIYSGAPAVSQTMQ